MGKEHEWFWESGHSTRKRPRYSRRVRSIREFAVKLLVVYFIINYLVFTGAILDISRNNPKTESITNTLKKMSILPPRDEAKIEQKVFELTNDVRARVGVRTLQYNKELSVLAKEHSEDMQRRGYFSHDTPEGLSPTDRAIKKGIGVVKDFGSYYQTGIGENIMDMPITYIPFFIQAEDCFIVLTNGQIAQCSVDGWVTSSGHYSNMIDPSYDEIGVGAYCNFWGCKLTQDFR